MRASILFIFALAVLVACQAPAEVETTPEAESVQTFACPDGTIVEDVASCPEIEIEQNVDQTDVEPEDVAENRPLADEIFAGDTERTEEVSTEVAAILARAADKTRNGYQFTFNEIVDGRPTDNNLNGAKIYVRDNLAVDYQSRKNIDGKQYTRLLEQDEIVYAWCTQCSDTTVTELSADDFSLLRPVEILNALTDTELVGSRTLDRRSVMELSAQYESQEATVFVDDFSGVPVQLVLEDVRYEFRDLGLSAPQSFFELP